MEGFTFVLANEFFDALPFHRVIDRGGRLEEVYVGHEDGFFEQTGPLSRPLASFLDDYPVFLQEHQELEVTTAAAAPVEAVSRPRRKGLLPCLRLRLPSGRYRGGQILSRQHARLQGPQDT